MQKTIMLKVVGIEAAPGSNRVRINCNRGDKGEAATLVFEYFPEPDERLWIGSEVKLQIEARP